MSLKASIMDCKCNSCSSKHQPLMHLLVGGWAIVKFCCSFRMQSVKSKCNDTLCTLQTQIILIWYACCVSQGFVIPSSFCSVLAFFSSSFLFTWPVIHNVPPILPHLAAVRSEIIIINVTIIILYFVNVI